MFFKTKQELPITITNPTGRVQGKFSPSSFPVQKLFTSLPHKKKNERILSQNCNYYLFIQHQTLLKSPETLTTNINNYLSKKTETHSDYFYRATNGC